MKHFGTIFTVALLLCCTFCFGQWNSVSINPGKYVQAFSFVNDDIGYAMMTEVQTSVKTLEKTTDGGNSWVAITLPVMGPELQSLDFHSDGHGVVVLRDLQNPITPTLIYQTANDGTNWQNITPDTTGSGLGTSVCQFLDQNTGFLAADVSLFATTDGGANWTKHTFVGYPMAIDFIDANHGTVGLFDGTFNYFGSMLTTADGGANWTTTALTDNGTVIGEVIQLTTTTSIAAPVKFGAYNQARFFKTTNNGLSWDTILVPDTLADAQLTDIAFKDVMNGVISVSSFTRTIMYETNDGGATWAFQDTLPWFTITDLVLTANTGYLGGNQGNFYKLAGPLAVQEPSIGQFQLFPNPVQSGHNIHWVASERVKQISIMDLSGKMVHQAAVSQSTATLPTLAAGIYVLRLEGEGFSSARKLVVEN